MLKMEDNTELEEGEARYYIGGDDDIDPDVALSYIDERIQHVLGHFQKDFEGGVSAENLGAKFGGYGSFLPTYERSPSIWANEKTPQRTCNSVRTDNFPREGTSHKSKTPLNEPPSVKLGTASSSDHSKHNTRALLSNASIIQDPYIPSAPVADKCTLIDESLERSGNLNDQKILKFRIKMKSDSIARKNAAIYSGLGLDNSPSSSMDNSPEESVGLAGDTPETTAESPMGIIQAMTAFPVPGGVLISPLHDSLLCLYRKEKAFTDSKGILSLGGQQEESFGINEYDSLSGEGGKLLNENKVSFVDKSEKKLGSKLINANGVDDDIDVVLHTNKKIINRTLEGRDLLSNDLKSMPVINSAHDVAEHVVVNGRACFSNDISKDDIEGRLVSSEPVKEEAVKSRSVMDNCKSQKQHSKAILGERVSRDKKVKSNNDSSVDRNSGGKYKPYMISTSVKSEPGVRKDEGSADFNKREMDQKHKPLIEVKIKSEWDDSPREPVAVIKNKSLKAEAGAVAKEKKNSGNGTAHSRSKMHKIKASKDNKVRESNRDPFKEKHVEWTGTNIDLLDVSSHDNIKAPSEFGGDVKEIPSSNKLIKDEFDLCPIPEYKPASETAAAAAPAPVVIAEDWVCCDICQTWRLLPFGTKPDQLPEKWICSMLDWLPEMNRCEFSEEETARALYALYQIPLPESQNNLQNHVSGTVVGMNFADVQNHGEKNQNPDSHRITTKGKKKHSLKEMIKAGSSNDPKQLSSSRKYEYHESQKSRSSIDGSLLTESNAGKKSSSQPSSKLHNLGLENHILKQKEKQMNGGDGKKIKRKREVDQCRFGTPKKSKNEDMYQFDKQKYPNKDLGKVVLNSTSGLPNKASGKNAGKCDEHILFEDARDKLSMKKQVDQAQVSSNGVSLDVTNGSKMTKKRKLVDQKDRRKLEEPFTLHDSKPYVEGSSESGCIKGNKYKMSMTEAKESNGSIGDDKLKRKGRVAQVFVSSGNDHVAVGMEGVRSFDKDQQFRKNNKKTTTQPGLDAIDAMGRDWLSGQLSLAATSSSSKVSGSHKTRTNLEDMKSSPVESVTSSPLRASNLEKLTSAAGYSFSKDNAHKGRHHLMSNNFTTCFGREGTVDTHFETHRKSSTECLNGDDNKKASGKFKPLSNDKNGHLLNEGCGTNPMEDCYIEDRVEKNCGESAASFHKCSDSGSSMQAKEKNRRSSSEFQRDMTQDSSGNGLPKNGLRYESEMDKCHQASHHKARMDVKSSFPKSIKPKHENDGKSNSVVKVSSEGGFETELKDKQSVNSVLKVGGPCNTNGKIHSQQNMNKDSETSDRSDPSKLVSRAEKLKEVILSPGGEAKNERSSAGSQSASQSQKGSMSNGHLVNAPGNGDLSKLTKSSNNAGIKNDVNHALESSGLNQQLTASSPVWKGSSGQNVVNTIKEAKNLREYADRLKSSGFDFESNEAYFQAALKYLHGASLIEGCNNESSKHWEMNQVQMYGTTAKLCEFCAHYYEERKEMAAAALAYKCMEVAYMRIIYSKNSCTNKDRHELQTTLQILPQGESPSSSASDIDNLNNQAAADKTNFLKGSGSYVGNQVIAARNRPNFARLLEFTQDVNFAMEASRKSQNAFAAANITIEESQIKDCISSVKRVIDFSFQDVDELLRLVRMAMEAISHSGLGGARD